MRLLFVLYTLMALSTAGADTPLAIGGSLDFNYIWNFNQPPPVTSPSETVNVQPPGNNSYRAFDLYHDDINLALAELTLQKTTDDSKIFVALDFGHTAEILSPHDEVTHNISQAYLTYSPHQLQRLSLSAGKMLTHMGLETMHTKDNWNYSRSVLFTYAIPLWHTGLAAHYGWWDDKISTGIYLYNKTYGLYQTNRSKTVGAQIKYNADKSQGYTYNFLSGPELDNDGASHVRMLNEFIVNYELRPDLNFAAEAILGQLSHARDNGRNAQWFAWSAAFKWTQGIFSLSPRFEVYTDTSGASVEIATAAKPALPMRMQSVTLTASLDCGSGIETRFEVREDDSSTAVFTKANGALSPSQLTSTVGLLYEF